MTSDIVSTTKNTVSHPQCVEPRKIYLIKVSDTYHRIVINAFDNDNKENLCHCFFIDFGTNGWHSRDIIFDCPAEFQIIPKFAIKFSLFRLEDFSENPLAREFVSECLSNKTVQSVIRSDATKYLSGNLGAAISVIFFETVVNGNRINLNQVILEKTCDAIPTPTLFAEIPNQVQISYVSPFDGSIYCHTEESQAHLRFIENVINRLANVGIASLFKHVLPSDLKCNSELYLAYDRDEKRWYRAQVLLIHGDQDHHQTPSRSASCFFVDYGMTKKISFHNICTLTGVLSKYPHQALRTVLDGVQMTSEQIGCLRQLLNPKDVVSVNLVHSEMCASEVPQVIIKKY